MEKIKIKKETVFLFNGRKSNKRKIMGKYLSDPTWTSNSATTRPPTQFF